MGSGSAVKTFEGGMAGIPALRRALREGAPAVRAALGGAPPLEMQPSDDNRPRLVSATLIEGADWRPRPVGPGESTGFVAFLDGIQRSNVIGYSGVVPVVIGTVAAAIRIRRERRMSTWAHAVERRAYLPLSLVGDDVRDALSAVCNVCDVSVEVHGAGALTSHPLDLAERAYHFVQNDRERVERSLLGKWLAEDNGVLFVDGGIGSVLSDDRVRAVGVVKSHRTIYAEGAGLELLMGLGAGERSPVFQIESQRATVASWYLRLRDPAGRDPLWGLVRLEISGEDLALARADELSRWVLAETVPLSLPDSRWDRMSYGIRDCEEFLRAILDAGASR
jgi:hypothetical protein